MAKDLSYTKVAWQLTLLATVLVGVNSGCARLYHAVHYNGISRGLHDAPRSYYHSPNTGRIIPKDVCYSPEEPACFGFEPTCWRQWPEECVGCPVADDVINGQIIVNDGTVHEGVIHDGIVHEGVMTEQPVGPITDYPDEPPTPEETDTPGIDASNGDSIESPSDVPGEIEATPGFNDDQANRNVTPRVSPKLSQQARSLTATQNAKSSERPTPSVPSAPSIAQPKPASTTATRISQPAPIMANENRDPQAAEPPSIPNIPSSQAMEVKRPTTPAFKAIEEKTESDVIDEISTAPIHRSAKRVVTKPQSRKATAAPVQSELQMEVPMIPVVEPPLPVSTPAATNVQSAAKSTGSSARVDPAELKSSRRVKRSTKRKEAIIAARPITKLSQVTPRASKSVANSKVGVVAPATATQRTLGVIKPEDRVIRAQRAEVAVKSSTVKRPNVEVTEDFDFSLMAIGDTPAVAEPRVTRRTVQVVAAAHVKNVPSYAIPTKVKSRSAQNDTLAMPVRTSMRKRPTTSRTTKKVERKADNSSFEFVNDEQQSDIRISSQPASTIRFR